MNAEEKIKKDIKKPKKKKTIEKNEIDYLNRQITKLTNELSGVQNVTSNFNIEAPWVHCKINVVKGGRSPKTEISLSAGGAIDQLSFPDVETFVEKLIMIIKKEIDDTMAKLTTEE